VYRQLFDDAIYALDWSSLPGEHRLFALGDKDQCLSGSTSMLNSLTHIDRCEIATIGIEGGVIEIGELLCD
jgi:hypothetical protein